MAPRLSIWIATLRPKTLPLAILPIAIGSSLAHVEQHFQWPIFILSTLTALLLQILANLANDYGDSVKGTDNVHRIGPARAMQTGVVSTKGMKLAIALAIALTGVCGGLLIYLALPQWSSRLLFVALGGLATLAALAYTMGKRPYGYAGFGDLAVFVFFGLVGVIGSYYLHTGFIERTVVLPAIGYGLSCVTVLNINNIRDIDNDKACGKMTLAAQLGLGKAKCYHALLLLGSALCYGVFFGLYLSNNWRLVIGALMVLIVVSHGKNVVCRHTSQQFVPLLANSVRVCIVTSTLFIAPVLLSPWS
ncbi:MULTISPECIES: 1,4-dihydroxy-2-naphthoate polyprenyltransferase [unclassified Vibrio]|uniref:1,4-dihydroxy-2-naphthoate octaprenyltransferase n=1 Tax=Vibrio sp. HB236076 TaxID=3232307 RepID=A0AB39HAW8_9VIBR|nr:1,4-dihydroxy-2-naphthoate polyprenyltransferase [Vibrio sp. HB161653]MDP5255794.1 1,4-dihydroxy-2-naphthoate polyprenyltransferase [Vibrio sp. HB161653]